MNTTTTEQLYWLGVFDEDIQAFVATPMERLTADQLFGYIAELTKEITYEDTWASIKCGPMWGM